MKTCRHCGSPEPSRPRGLCWRCYYTPRIRALYPESLHPKGRRGVPHPRHVRLASFPTGYPPGSYEKMVVMRGRAERGEELFHPLDATFATPEQIDFEPILPLPARDPAAPRPAVHAGEPVILAFPAAAEARDATPKAE